LGEPNARFILLAAHMPSAGIHFGPVLSGLLNRGGTTVRTRSIAIADRRITE
jgi:hypothetical protein